METQSYKVAYQGGSDEIVEKKSRFIATIEPIEREEDAVAFINAVRKKYWDAKHHCFAFTIGRNHELTRCSDDGEPSGTAGRPMLDVLLREDIHNVAAVVTRYFGGILLGTGGLVRAYQKSLQAGLAASAVIEKQTGTLLEIKTDYNGLGKIQYLLAQRSIPVQETLYTEKVAIYAVVAAGQKGEVWNAVTEGTNGTAVLSWQDDLEFALLEGQLKIL